METRSGRNMNMHMNMNIGNMGLVDKLRKNGRNIMEYMKGLSERNPTFFNYLVTLSLSCALPTLIFVTFSVVTFSIGFGILLAVETALLFGAAIILGWTLFGISVLSTIGFVWTVAVWKTLKLIGRIFKILWPSQLTQETWKQQIREETKDLRKTVKEVTPQHFTPVHAFGETFGRQQPHAPVNLQQQQQQRQQQQQHQKLPIHGKQPLPHGQRKRISPHEYEKEGFRRKREGEAEEEGEEEQEAERGGGVVTGYINKVGEFIGNALGIEKLGYHGGKEEEGIDVEDEEMYSSSEYSSEDESHEHPRTYVKGHGYLHNKEDIERGKPPYAQMVSRGVENLQHPSQLEPSQIGRRQRGPRKPSKPINLRYEGKTIPIHLKKELLRFNRNNLRHINLNEPNLNRFLKNETEPLRLHNFYAKSHIPGDRSDVEYLKLQQDYEGGPPKPLHEENELMNIKKQSQKKIQQDENLHTAVSGRTIAT